MTDDQSAMIIRGESPSDHAAIHDLTTRAFAPMPYAGGNEAQIIDALRRTGKLHLSLVAMQDNRLIGHVAFSPVFITSSMGDWYGLGPISVAPERQKQGIGRQLIAEGMARLKAQDAAGCVLIGNPAVYAGSGFIADGALSCGAVPTSYIQWLAFDHEPPRGALHFDPAFHETSPSASDVG